MVNFLLTTGPFLVPLLILSLYSVALMVDKARFLKKNAPLTDGKFDELLEAVHRGRAPEALESDHPFSRYLASHRQDPTASSLLQAKAQAEVARLEDRLSYFPALANLATLLGLFGTVCGMITSFLALRSGGGADPAALAGGIAQALSATALGLVVAIPNLAAHAIFQKKVQTAILQWESLMGLTLPEGSGGPGA